MSRLTARLERLEAVLKPSGRAFVLLWRADKDGPLAEKEAEYRAEQVLDRTTRSSRSSSVLSDEGQSVGSHLRPNKKYQL
jgi:hypothetical protein